MQITWKEQTGFVYNASTLEVVRTFPYQTSNGEGWGITAVLDSTAANTTVLAVSDGSTMLMTWDVTTMKEIARIGVSAHFATGRSQQPAAEPNRQPIRLLNELEWDPHDPRTVLANVWYQDVLVRIDLDTGHVRTVYDLTSLYPVRVRDPTSDVLNGIVAIPSQKGEYWVTGKQWPSMYRIRLVDP